MAYIHKHNSNMETAHTQKSLHIQEIKFNGAQPLRDQLSRLRLCCYLSMIWHDAPSDRHRLMKTKSPFTWISCE
jgi:hypothetical protein